MQFPPLVAVAARVHALRAFTRESPVTGLGAQFLLDDSGFCGCRFRSRAAYNFGMQHQDAQPLDYPRMLLDGFAATESHSARQHTRFEYLSEHIFDFNTYDSDMAKLFASKALEVCAAVLNKTTFDYIEDPDQYRWYMVMCNMPFFKDRLDWGVSIRGAWWQFDDTEFSSCGLWIGDRQYAGTLTLDQDQWRAFIAAVIAFGAE